MRDVPSLRVSVLLPTFGRPAELARCLDALKGQDRVPDEVILVVRRSDDATHALLRDTKPGSLPIRVCEVVDPGIVAALNQGLHEIKGDVIAMTDDDAVPHSDWIERIATHFATDRLLGALGGRDWIFHDGRRVEGSAPVVGKLTAYGHMTGNHHLGAGAPRTVDLLKGVNMSYRAEAVSGLEFDRRLRGGGAQERNEVGFVLSVRDRGWRVVYDPSVEVDHHLGARVEGPSRKSELGADLEGLADMAFNDVVGVWDHLPRPGRWAFAAWSLLIGSRDAPGLAQTVRFLPRAGTLALRRFAAVQRAKAEAIATMRRGSA